MSKSNDQIFDDLELLKEYAHINSKETLDALESIVKKRKPHKPQTISNLKGFGKLKGKSHEDILIECTEILGRIRYFDIKRVFKLTELLYGNQDAKVKSASLKIIENLAKYDLFALQQIGYLPQELILEVFKKWSNKVIKKNIDLIFTASQKMLQASFEGHSNPDYRSITFHSGSLVFDERLKKVRNETILFLEKVWGLTENVNNKTKIINALECATHFPNHVYKDELEQMILADTIKIIKFYIEILPSAENEIIQDIEEQKVWFLKRFPNKLSEDIKSLEEAINSNKNYDLFRLLVGYDGRLDVDGDYDKSRENRLKSISETISEISDDNFEEWREKITSVVKNYDNSDPGVYSYFGIFLTELGEKKPGLVFKLIERNEKELKPFSVSLLLGIWKSDQKTKAKGLINSWIKQGKHLSACAFLFTIVEDIDKDIIHKLFEKAVILKDVATLNNLLRVIFIKYNENKDLKHYFLDIIKEFTKIKNTYWVHHLWFQKSLLLTELTSKEYDIILNGIILCQGIDWEAEQILDVIAKKYPEKVIDFFEKRVLNRSKMKKGLDNHYDAIPFNIHELGETFKGKKDIAIPMILAWFVRGDSEEQNWLLRWEGSQLLEKIFPGFDETLEKLLINIINKAGKKGRDTAFSILGKYNGEDFLYVVVKAMVKKYFKTKLYKETKGHLFGLLSQTGVVSGEDGFVRAYQAKKKSIKKLTEDIDPQIKSFFKDYEKYLEKNILYQQKRSNEETELMKRGIY